MVGAVAEVEQRTSTTAVSIRSMTNTLYHVDAATVPVSRHPLPVPSVHVPVVLAKAPNCMRTRLLIVASSEDAAPAAMLTVVPDAAEGFESVRPVSASACPTTEAIVVQVVPVST